jgi:hypothetical protein
MTSKNIAILLWLIQFILIFHRTYANDETWPQSRMDEGPPKDHHHHPPMPPTPPVWPGSGSNSAEGRRQVKSSRGRGPAEPMLMGPMRPQPEPEPHGTTESALVAPQSSK